MSNILLSYPRIINAILTYLLDKMINELNDQSPQKCEMIKNYLIALRNYLDNNANTKTLDNLTYLINHIGDNDIDYKKMAIIIEDLDNNIGFMVKQAYNEGL